MATIGERYVNVVYPFEYTEVLIPHSSYKVLVRRDGSGYVEDMGDNSIEVVLEPLSNDDHPTYYTLKDEVAELKAENEKLRRQAASSKENSIEWRKLYYEVKEDLAVQRKATVDESGRYLDLLAKLESIIND